MLKQASLALAVLLIGVVVAVASDDNTAPRCRSGAKNCKPWERDWRDLVPPKETTILDDGRMLLNGKPTRLIRDPFAKLDIKPNGWTFVKNIPDPDRALYYMAPVIRLKGSAPRIWLRVEYATIIAKKYRSNTYLFELDCSQRRVRELQSTGYSKNNLEGSSDDNLQPTTWRFIEPGQLAEIQKIVCSAQ